MSLPRIIPCLLLSDGMLVKTVKFNSPAYIGDPINTVKIYNEKEVDELIILNINLRKPLSTPDINFLAKIVSESFMPVCYGGGIRTIEDAQRIFEAGVEKIALNAAVFEKPAFIEKLAMKFGSQSIVGVVNYKKYWLRGFRVYNTGTRKSTKMLPVNWANRLVELGVGELLINSVDRDGTYLGYDKAIISEVSKTCNVPVIACGGASTIEDCVDIVMNHGASAAAAGSIFVYYGPHRAVLINYPKDELMKDMLNGR